MYLLQPIRVCLGALLALLPAAAAMGADRPTPFDEGRLQIALPDGWKVTQQSIAGSDSIAGWESSDRKTSLYVHRLPTMSQAADMRNSLQATIEAMDQADHWLIQKIGDYRDITLGGLPAVYVSVEAELRAGERKTPFRFHFAMIGAARAFYLLQASNIQPVRQIREDEIIRMMKSFQVLREE
ncbi:MAG: hypothetical protein JNK37_14110 [Verrucomicrobiales bacterium]|nr:hypothetical protein [Verrucomicrobiales bacterium]